MHNVVFDNIVLNDEFNNVFNDVLYDVLYNVLNGVHYYVLNDILNNNLHLVYYNNVLNNLFNKVLNDVFIDVFNDVLSYCATTDFVKSTLSTLANTALIKLLKYVTRHINKYLKTYYFIDILNDVLIMRLIM